jgi:hypothetical protein
MVFILTLLYYSIYTFVVYWMVNTPKMRCRVSTRLAIIHF